MAYDIKPLGEVDRSWVRAFVTEHWGAPAVISRGQVHYPERLPGFYALVDGARAGLVTYHISGAACEIVSLDSLQAGIGLGSALVGAVRAAAAAAGCTRLWLITTNDNLHALRFYQKRGFELVAVHRGAVQESRRLKPQIPLIGLDGIPLRDEIELEMNLA